MRRLQDAFGEYYTVEHDRTELDASNFIRLKAAVQRKHGMTGRQLGMTDFTSMIVAVTNTAPACYWMVHYIFSRPQLADQIRNEVSRIVARRGEEAVCTINVSHVEAECPLFTSCYKEMIRLMTGFVVTRTAMEDITVSDSHGRAYLLKKGVVVQVPFALLLQSKSAWGDDANQFDPERFLRRGHSGGDMEKARRLAYFPFSSGRHLCPGRNFAFLEIAVVLVTLLVGFEVNDTGKGWNGVEAAPAAFGTSILKPAKDGEGQGIAVTRRQGWETVKWRYRYG